jgi:hypothetical protein
MALSSVFSRPPDADSSPSLVTRTADQATTFVRMTTAGVTVATGILIFNSVNKSVQVTTGGIDKTPIVETIEGAFQLFPILLIIIVSALILAQVAGFRGN